MNIIQEPPFGLQKPLLHYSTSNHIAKERKNSFFLTLKKEKQIIDNTVNIVRSTNNKVRN